MRRIALVFLFVLGLCVSANAQIYGPSSTGNNFGGNRRGDSFEDMRGFWGMIEASPLGMDLFNVYYTPNLMGVYGYQFNPYLFLGVAVGVGVYSYYDYHYDYYGPGFVNCEFAIPIAADFRYYVNGSINTLFFGARTGFLVPFEEPFFGSVKIGYQFAWPNGKASNISLSLLPKSDFEVLQLQLNFGFEF